MNDYGFTSAFAAQLNRYLAFKESMGFYGSSRVWYLKRFDRYCVEGWVSDQLQRSGHYRSWMSYIRDFGRWLVAYGSESAYVLSNQWRAPFVPAQPYLAVQR